MRSERFVRRIAALVLLIVACDVRLAVAARPTVALVTSSTIGPFKEAADAMQERLRRDPSQPEILTFDLAGGQETAPEVLAQIRRASPVLIITVGSLATAVVLAQDWSVPVLFSMVLYPAQSGFLDKRARGVTGASLDVPLELQFHTLRRLLPDARRVGVLYHLAETGSIIEAARTAAPREGLELDARSVEDPGAALAALTELMEHVDVLWTVADSHVFTQQTTSAMILAALRRRIPIFGLSAAQVRTGALAALSCDYADVGTQTAEIALRILHGERAADIPPSVPRKFSLALNLKTAEHLGIPLTPSIKSEAGEVVK